MKRKHLGIATIVALAMLICASSISGAAGVIRINVNGQEITPDVPAQIIDGRTMVPARFVAEALLANVTWDEATQTVKVQWPESIAAGIGLAIKMNENPEFKKEIADIYNKYYGSSSGSPAPTIPSTTIVVPNQTNELLKSQIQAQINSIKAQAESQRTAVISAYNTAKASLDNQRDAALKAATTGRNISSSPLSVYAQTEVLNTYMELYAELEETRDRALEEIDTWERNTLAPLENQLKLFN